MSSSMSKAAKSFLKFTKQFLREFNQYSKKPGLRVDLMKSHGVHEKWLAKGTKISDQACKCV